MDIIFFSAPSSAIDKGRPFLTLPEEYHLEYVTRSLKGIIPNDLFRPRSITEWIKGVARVYRRNALSILRIYRGDTLIHTGVLMTAQKSFPFMETTHLQITQAWTHPQHRGTGISQHGFSLLLYKRPRWCTQVWWLSRGNNFRACRMAEKLGFTPVGVGSRKQSRRFFSRWEWVLDQYIADPQGCALEV